MKILHVNTFDFVGGAARAVYRLHTGLKKIGVDNALLVAHKSSNDSSVQLPNHVMTRMALNFSSRFDHLPLLRYSHRSKVTPWSIQWFPNGIEKDIQEFKPDLVNLHWVGGFLPINSLKKIDCPVVWTLHDMWAMTGGCHYDLGCGKYRDECGRCPQLNSRSEDDISRRILRQKKREWAKLPITFVAPSRWLAECAQSSRLFSYHPIKVIPNGIDLKSFYPVEKKEARKMLGLQTDRKIILFGAMNSLADKRKGFQYLQPALQALRLLNPDIKFMLAFFGASKLSETMEMCGLNTYNLGHIKSDSKLAEIYSAADVFLAPSTQDNLPNTVIEALACGTPCVAFDTGGMPDMIKHKFNGYLAEPINPASLAEGINFILNEDSQHAALSANARATAEELFSDELQAQRYAELYKSL